MHYQRSISEAIENTNKMAESIEEFQLDYTPKYPKLYDNSEEKGIKQKKKIAKGLKERHINSTIAKLSRIQK